MASNNISYERKLDILRMLKEVAEIDSGLNDSELMLLTNISRLIQVDHKDLEVLLTEKNSDKPNFPKDESNRIFTFHSLLLMAGIDQHWSENEILLCKNYGLRLGLNQLAVEKLLQLQKASKDKAIAAEKVMEIFKTSYN